MINYPFDEQIAYIDRQGFETLATYFAVVDNLSIEDQGLEIFKWDNGWETLSNIPIEDLCRLSPFLLAYDADVFSETSNDRFAPEKLLDLMKKRGISSDDFLEHAGDVEFKVLGPESAQIVATIVEDLKPDNSYFCDSASTRHWYEVYRERFGENTRKLESYNKEKDCPFTLDQILTFDNEPACLRFSDDGRLYVLDTKIVLHEFTGTEKTGEWPLWMNREVLDINHMELGGFQSCPNIAVAGDHAFVVTGGFSLHRYNLSDHEIWDERVALDDQIYTGEGKGRIVNHDVIVKDGNVLVSMSDEIGFRRSIHQLNGRKFREIYEGRFPKSRRQSSGADHTLRLDLHKGHLFFPRGTGISLYRGMKPDGEKPKEMLVDYKRPEDPYKPVDPLTKFSLGNNFMVAQARLDGFKRPMLCAFRPVYEQRESRELLLAGMTPPPDRLELDYIGYPPKVTEITLRNASVSAYGDNFAITNSFFREVFVYKIDPLL